MPLTFYAGSGSPPTWRVWLTLEHKGMPYELAMLSFQAREQKRPAFVAFNPRGQVPVVVDDGFALYESSAICEYLEERFPDRPLLPADLRQRATVRRLCAEAQLYVGAAGEEFFALTLYGTKKAAAEEIAGARDELGRELARWESLIAGDFVAGAELSMADFALYPMVGTLRRLDHRKPELRGGDLVGPRLGAWMKTIEALPYFEKTYPPHWKS